MSFYSLFDCMLSNEPSTIILILIPLQVMCLSSPLPLFLSRLSCYLFFFSSLNIICQFFVIYSAWCFLRYLDIWLGVYHQFGKVFGYYYLKYVIFSIFSFFLFLVLVTCVIPFEIIPQFLDILLCFCFCFSSILPPPPHFSLGSSYQYVFTFTDC